MSTITQDENELLTRIEGDAPMGRVMRRHWIPICMVEEVAQADGAPLKLRVLGEDLVLFRDTAGKLGLLGENCPHRRASLAFGRNEDGGLRCLFHGWKIDVEGVISEMPSERFAGAGDRRRHLAYPVRESGAFVWAYMGDRASMPEFTPPPWANARKVSIGKAHAAVNWAQVIEGSLDSVHSQFLHSSLMRPGSVSNTTSPLARGGQERPTADRSPRTQVQLTTYGMRYATMRKPVERADTHVYMRVNVFIAPFIMLSPPNTAGQPAQVVTPIDHENSMFYFVTYTDGEGLDQEALRKFLGLRVGIDVDANYRKLRNKENMYLQDRKAMKLGDFSGIYGLAVQDIAMWETMGSVADRTQESLGSYDLAIMQFRRLMIAAARAERDGGAAVVPMRSSIPYTDIRGFEGIVPNDTDWRTLAVTEPEKAMFVERVQAAGE